MRKIISLSLFTFIALSATAQVQTQVIGDSVFVHSNSSTGELILQNSTDTVNGGFLYNNGLGRTAFKRVLLKINDSTYLIGADTLHIHSLGGGGNYHLPYNGNSTYYLGGDTLLHSMDLIDSNFAKNDLTFTGLRTHNGVGYSLILKNNPSVTINSDTFRLRNRPNLTMRINSLKTDSTLQDGKLVLFGADSSSFYCDCVNGGDATNVNSDYILRGITHLVIERRYNYDSIVYFVGTSSGTHGFLQIITANLDYSKYSPPYKQINIRNNATGIITSFPYTKDTIYYPIPSTSNVTYTILFSNLTRGFSHIIASPDSSGIPNNIVYFDQDTMKLAPYPGITSGTITSIIQGYGIIHSPNPIISTGTITIDSAALHLKFLGLSDSTIYYPYASNPKNYLTSTSAISITNQTANYTLQLSDAGKLITQTNAAASSVTVPPNSSVAFPIGSKIIVNQYGSGQVSIANGAGVAINSPGGTLKTSAQYGTVMLIKIATDAWILNGDLTNTINTYDVDAKKFIDSSGITDSLTKLAIDNLVIQLKDSSLWSSFAALYPMVGGTATTTKWNLKDPRNLDAAYRLTYTGSPTFASTGVLFPTTSDYASTHLADNALSGGYANNSISYYSRTQNTISGYDMGCADNVTYYNEFTIYYPGDATNWFGYSAYSSPASTKGLFMLSSTASNVKRYENGIASSSKGSAPTTGFTNLPILLGKVAAAGAGGKRECAFASIGVGMTDAQALTLYNIVQNFEVTLGRN